MGTMTTFISEKLLDTPDEICQLRGHVKPNTFEVTTMYCPPHIEDTKDSSVMVYPACNYYKYTCMRCGQYVKEKEPERRILLWKNDK